MRRQNHSLSQKITFCGIFSSLALIMLLAGSLFSLAVYLFPILAGLVLLPVAEEYGMRGGLSCYFCVSLLGALILPDKEALILFIALLGYYPFFRPLLGRIKPLGVRLLCKLALFNSTVLAAYWCMLHLFPMPALQAELTGYTHTLLTVLLLLANLTFLLYDISLARILLLYRKVLLPRIRKALK